MSGQVDIGFSTPPFGLDALAEGRSRLIALANDLPSVRNQTVRLIIANATDLAKRREVYDRFIKAYREAIDWMYSDPQAIEAFAKYASIPPATAQTVRDQFYPKSMLQLDEVEGHAGADAGRDRVQIHSGGADASSSSTSCCNCRRSSRRARDI